VSGKRYLPGRLARPFWWLALRLRFHLWQRHRHNHLVLERLAGRPFLVLPAVFNPTLFFSSEFMVGSFNETLIPAGAHLLDVGTGSGVGAVFAADWAAQVTAVDVNPAAVRCARINVLLNGVEDRVAVQQSDLFTAVAHRRFDVILFNPPYYRGQPHSSLDHAFHATDVLERFSAALPDHLTAAGHALVLLSSAGDEAAFLKLWHDRAWRVDVAAVKHLPLEVLTLYRLVVNGGLA
jgi:HemK-related putative methylase